MSAPTNRQRVMTATAAMQNFYSRIDQTEALIDLLTDLMHWCDVHGVRFNTAVDVAKRHYAEEVRR
jgi:hypothetical protein